MAGTEPLDRSLAARIELLVLDVDGVLTDGRVTYTSAGDEIKSFNAKDGAGMKYWQRVGKKLAILTGRDSPTVTRRAEELGVDVVVQNAKYKLTAFQQILDQLGVAAERTAAIGDDLMDLPVLTACGFPVAVADASQELKAAAAYVTKLPGGAGCVRETIELILKSAGLWGQVMARYLPSASDPAPAPGE